MRHIEPHSVVAHEVYRLASVCGLTELDASFPPFCGKLPRIAEEIVEYDTEQPFITVGYQAVGDEYLDPTFRLVVFESRRGGVGETSQIDPLAAQLTLRQLSKHQQIFNQLRHELRGGSNPVQMLLAHGIELLGVIFEQRQTEPVDAAQRRT